MQRLASIACALFAAAHALTYLGASPLDDEFILYRYAANLLAGHGLVFEPGTRVEGFTQPLWLFLLAGWHALGLPLVLGTRLFGVACAAGAVYFTGEAWRTRFPASPWPIPALFLASLPAFAFHAVAGLGTPLLALALAAWMFASVRDEERMLPGLAAPSMLGLAGLARPEAALFVALDLGLARRPQRLLRALLAVLPLTAWTLFRLAYYGRFLPATYAVKKLPFAVDLLYGARYLGRATLETGALVWLALGLWALWHAPVALGRGLRSAAFGALLHTGYVLYVGGDYMTLARFVLPVLPLLVVTGWAGVWSLLHRRPRAFAAAAVLALVACQWTQLGPRREVFELHAANEERWIALGRALAERAAPGTKVAVSAVGAIGYHSRLPIVDLLGRTNTALADAPPDLAVALKSHHRHDGRWALDQEPDLILLGAGRVADGTQTLLLFQWEADLLADPRFAAYEPIALPVDGSYPLYAFLRAGAPMPRGALPAKR